MNEVLEPVWETLGDGQQSGFSVAYARPEDFDRALLIFSRVLAQSDRVPVAVAHIPPQKTARDPLGEQGFLCARYVRNVAERVGDLSRAKVPDDGDALVLRVVAESRSNAAQLCYEDRVFTRMGKGNSWTEEV